MKLIPEERTKQCSRKVDKFYYGCVEKFLSGSSIKLSRSHWIIMLWITKGTNQIISTYLLRDLFVLQLPSESKQYQSTNAHDLQELEVKDLVFQGSNSSVY